MNPYESERLLGEYLLFHYGTAAEILPWTFGPRQGLFYPVRCVSECVEVEALPENSRALDVGCAVGRAAFELARDCTEVIGVDFSQSFIAAATSLREKGELAYRVAEEGERVQDLIARVPSRVERTRVSFEAGDAMDLRADLGVFDVVLAANLIDRLREPRAFLRRLPGLVTQGGQLVLTSPYTWLEEFTPREHWLGGKDGQTTQAALEGALTPDFELRKTLELPFLIREHARKYQWSVAQATVWRRR